MATDVPLPSPERLKEFDAAVDKAVKALPPPSEQPEEPGYLEQPKRPDSDKLTVYVTLFGGSGRGGRADPDGGRSAGACVIMPGPPPEEPVVFQEHGATVLDALYAAALKAIRSIGGAGGQRLYVCTDHPALARHLGGSTKIARRFERTRQAIIAPAGDGDAPAPHVWGGCERVMRSACRGASNPHWALHAVVDAERSARMPGA